MQLQQFCATAALPHIPVQSIPCCIRKLQRLLFVAQLLLPQHSLQLVRPSAVLRLEQALERRQPLGALCPRCSCESDLHGSQQEMHTSAGRHKTAWAPRVNLTAHDARAASQCRKGCAGTARARQHRRSGSQHRDPASSSPLGCQRPSGPAFVPHPYPGHPFLCCPCLWCFSSCKAFPPARAWRRRRRRPPAPPPAAAAPAAPALTHPPCLRCL